jgi:hypothetical protein
MPASVKRCWTGSPIALTSSKPAPTATSSGEPSRKAGPKVQTHGLIDVLAGLRASATLQPEASESPYHDACLAYCHRWAQINCHRWAKISCQTHLASLTSTCWRHDVDPQFYLTQLLVNPCTISTAELPPGFPINDQWNLPTQLQR